MKNGKDYEKFVASIQQAVLNSEELIKQKNIKIELNKKIKDNLGILREFDLYWEYELGGIIYKTVIECKDYNTKVSIDKIDALIGKIRDIPDVRAVFATKKGYQKGAKIKAQNHSIDLLVVREQNESDWIDKDGNSLIKEIFIDMKIYPAAEVYRFEPYLDKNWAKNNHISTDSFNILVRNDELYINDFIENRRYTLLEYQQENLTYEKKGSFGKFRDAISYDNAYLEANFKQFKLLGFIIEYEIKEPDIGNFNIDFSEELLGIIEYLFKNKKKKVYKGGHISELET